MARCLFVIEYQGTNYLGWQKQPFSFETIQFKIENAIAIILKKKYFIHGASRTDAGVHAKGQLAIVDLPFNTDIYKLQFSINGLIPADIRIIHVFWVDDKFHPRYHNLGKRYIYNVWNSNTNLTFNRHNFWFVYQSLDHSLILQSIKIISAINDFKIFRGRKSQSKSNIKNITRFDVVFHYLNNDFAYNSIILNSNFNPNLIKPCHIEFIIEADSFLKQMIRSIIGTIIDIARKKITIDQLNLAIKDSNRSLIGVTAPPSGLILDKIFI